jgi:hypothetical protein
MTIHTQQKTNGFEIKEGDTSPFLSTVLLDGEGVPLDLTNATGVTLTMAMCDHPRTVVLNAVAADFNATAAGEVWYEWQAGDTDTPGMYNIEWTVTYPAGMILTVPSKGYDRVEVTRRL